MEKSDLRSVSRFLRDSSDLINETDARGVSALQYACNEHVSVGVFVRLVESGAASPPRDRLAYVICGDGLEADAAGRGSFGRLHCSDQVKKLRYLVAHNFSDLHYIDPLSGRCPFDFAARTDQVLLLDYLHGLGCDDPDAISQGASQYAALCRLLKWGQDPNRSGGWPLSAACEVTSDARCVETLIEHGADPRLTVALGQTPLMKLGRNYHLSPSSSIRLARLLVAKGARIDAVDTNGLTALYDAVSSLNADLAAEYIRMGVPDHTNEIGHSARWAIEQDMAEEKVIQSPETAYWRKNVDRMVSALKRVGFLAK